MRKFNAILSAVILILFSIHAFLGTLNLTGIASVITRQIAWSTVDLIILHTVLGTVLTIKSIRIWHKTKVSYWKENLLFWGRRISGFVIMILIVFHITALSTTNVNGLRLPLFDEWKLATQILLVIAIAFHVITNVKPMLISFGIKKLKPKAGDIIFWLSVLLLAAVVGFIIYYIRWISI